jgi:hypothetical protein
VKDNDGESFGLARHPLSNRTWLASTDSKDNAMSNSLSYGLTSVADS